MAITTFNNTIAVNKIILGTEKNGLILDSNGFSIYNDGESVLSLNKNELKVNGTSILNKDITDMIEYIWKNNA